MMGVTLNSIHSSTYDLVMLSKNRQLLPNLADGLIYVPFRSGSYLQPGKFNDRLITVEFGVVADSLTDLRSRARLIAAWLYTKARVPLIFDDEPGMTYNAKAEGAIDFESTLIRKGKFTVVFRCEPFAIGVSRMKPVLVDAPVFTRSGIATLRDLSQVASGVARFEQGYFHNLLTDNQASFETDTTGVLLWGASTTAVRDTTRNYKGGACLKITATNAFDGAGVGGIKVKPNQAYTASAYMSGAVGGEVVLVQFNWYDANGVFISSSPASQFTITGGWVRYTHTATSPANAATVQLKFSNLNAVLQNYYVDAVQVEEGSTAKDWILPSLGKAIMIEQNAINQCLYSDPSSAAQAFTATNVTFAVGVFPNLANVGVFGDNTLQRALYVGTATLNPNNGYTISCYVKMDDGTAPVVGTTTTSGDFGLVVNNYLVTGTTKVEPMGNEIYRVSAQYTTPGTITQNAGGVIKYTTSTAKTFKVGGFQIENRNFVTSYFPTTGVAGTRNGETLEFKPQAGTVFANGGSIGGRFKMADLDNSHNGSIIQIYDSVGGKTAVYIHRYQNMLFVIDYGITNYGITTPPLQLDTWHDFVWTWSTKNGRNLYLDGVLRKTVAYYNPLIATDKGYIGSSSGGAYLNGLIDDLFISQRELTAAEVLAYHNATKQYQVDADTTYSLAFDANLSPGTVTNVVNNLGTASTLPVITAIFTKAGATDFKITHLESGKSIRVIYNFALNDVLVIDHEKCLVTINGLRAMTSLDLSSRFFELDPGDNTLVATTTGGGAYTKVDYEERWL